MTANPLRGEVELKAGDKSHLLRLGVTSMMLLEKEFGGLSLPQIMQKHFSKPNDLLVSDMHRLLWAAMQRKESAPSKDEVEVIMDEAGLQACGAVVGELLAATFAKPEEGDENPPKASQESTGEN